MGKQGEVAAAGLRSQRSAFAVACAERRIGDDERAALWRLLERWNWHGADRSQCLRSLLEDFDHWRLYLLSRAGDEAAAGEFQRYWRGYVRAFLGRRFSAEQTEELVSAFFARLYRLVREPFDWHCPFTVYLRAMVVNLARDEARRLALARARQVGLDDGEDPPAARLRAGGPNPEQQVLAAETVAACERALAELKPLDRHILRACLVEGVPGQDLARELGLSRAALYQRLHRARERVKLALGRGGFGSDAGRGGVSRG